jgi:hypothetical protein
MEAMIEMMV